MATALFLFSACDLICCGQETLSRCGAALLEGTAAGCRQMSVLGLAAEESKSAPGRLCLGSGRRIPKIFSRSMSKHCKYGWPPESRLVSVCFLRSCCYLVARSDNSMFEFD